MDAAQQDKHEKAAEIRVSLHADSGYTSEVRGRISAEQWGRICAIIHEPAATKEQEHDE